MSDCATMMEKVNEKINGLEQTMFHISHGFTTSLGPTISPDDINDPMAMYDLVDAMQDVRDSIMIAKLFGCLVGKPVPYYISASD